MLGILSNSFQVATRQGHWSDKDAAPQAEAKLQAHWREDRRERFSRKTALEQAADGARPKLFGW